MVPPLWSFGLLACLPFSSAATGSSGIYRYSNTTQLETLTSYSTSSTSTEGTTSSASSKNPTSPKGNSSPAFASSASTSAPLSASESSTGSAAGLGSYILAGIGGSPVQSSPYITPTQSSLAATPTFSFNSSTVDNLDTTSSHTYTLRGNSTDDLTTASSYAYTALGNSISLPDLPSSRSASDLSYSKNVTKTGTTNATTVPAGTANTTSTTTTTRPVASGLYPSLSSNVTTRPVASGFYPFPIGNTTTATATNATSAYVNVSLASTGSGSVYASQCNSELLAWSVSSNNINDGSVYTKVSYITYTNWSAQTTTLGGCDARARLVGSFTPTATGVITSSYVSFGTSSIPPSPTCSINPSDCSALRYSSVGQGQSLINAQFRAQATLILAPSATALTVISLNTVVNSRATTVTTFGAAAMTPPPILTWDGTTYPADQVELTIGTESYTAYHIDDSYGQQVLKEGDSVVVTTSVSSNYIPPPQCSVPASDPGCGACTIYGGEVQLLYFPVSANVSRDMCATAPGPPTTCPLGPLTAAYTPATALSLVDFHGCTGTEYCPYLMGNTSTRDSGPRTVFAGTTLYANRAYISLQTVYAANQCGRVGAGHGGSLVTLASSQVYSIHSSSTQCVEQGYSFNFADLLPNLPQSAWSAAAPFVGDCASVINGVPQPVGVRNTEGLVDADDAIGDFVNGVPLGAGGPCGETIIDSAYFPTLLVPTQIRDLDPAWATCVIALQGLYDPPTALTLATTVIGPSDPVFATTTPASPASTRSSTQPTATAVTSKVSSPSAQPAKTSNPGSSDSTSSAAPKKSATDSTHDTTSTLASADNAGSSNLGAAGSILSDALSSIINSVGKTVSSNLGAGSISTHALSSSTTAGSDPGGIIASLLGGSKTTTETTPTPESGPAGGSTSNQDAKTKTSPARASNKGASSTSESGDPGASGPDTVTAGSSAFAVAATTTSGGSSAIVVAAGGKTATLSPGQTTSLAGQAISADSSGGVVIGSTTIAPTHVSGSTTAASKPDTITAGSSAFTVAATTTRDGSSAIIVAAGGTTATLTPGQITSLGGQAVSADSSGGVVIGSTTVVPTPASDPGSGSGSNSDPSSGAVIGLGGSSTLSVIQTIVTGSNGRTTTEAVIGGNTITQGAVTTIDGKTISLSPSGLVVDGTTQAISALPAATPAPSSGANLVLGSSTLMASQTVVVGENGQPTTEAVIGGSTLTEGGVAATIDGHTISLASNGLVIDGQSTISITALPAAATAQTEGAVVTLGSSTLTAAETVVIGSNGQPTTEVVLDGTTLSQGGPAATINGHTVTLASNGLVLDGHSSISISALPAATTAQISEGAVVTLGSSTLTAVETVVTGSNGRPTTEVILDGTTLAQGGLAATIGGHAVSLGSDGIIVDGSSTAQLSTLAPPSVVEALITLGSATLTASETLVTGVNGRTTLEAIVDGSTLLANGSPVIISGHTLSFGPDGIVVDGSQTDPFSTSTPTNLALVTFSEHGQIFTATPVPGRSGVYVIDGQTISVGGPQVTVDGLTVTAQSSNLIVDGTNTVSVTGGQASAPSVTATSPGPAATKLSAGDKGQELNRGYLWLAICACILAFFT